MEHFHLDFRGPFSWPGASSAPSVFECDYSESAGIYLWTVPIEDAYLVYYVGETGRSFSKRFAEHYAQHAAGFYHIYAPREFATGQKVMLWPGRHDVDQKRSVRECVEAFRSIATAISELSSLYRFFLAPSTAATGPRRRIESAIARTLYASPGKAGSFQDKGVHYESSTPGDPPLRCSIASASRLIEVPAEILA